MFRALPAAAAAWLAALSSAQPAAREIELIPSGPVSIDERTGEVVATNGARIFFDEWLLAADTVRYNRSTGEAEATGNVIFTRRDMRLTASYLRYNPVTRFARVEDFRVGNGRAYLSGAALEGDPDEFRFSDINFYPGEPGTFLFQARAGEVAVVNQGEIKGKRLFFSLGPVPFLLVPNIAQPIDVESPIFEPILDYSGHIGAVLGAEALLPVTPGLRLGGTLAYATRRGILAGPAAEYAFESEAYEASGSLDSVYINDQGDLGFDINGAPIEADRYFADWSHHQRWADNRASIVAYARYWSDSEVTRDFDEDTFDYLQNPDSYLQAAYNGDNWQLALFTRYHLNDFEYGVNRLPELRFSLFPTRVKGPVTHSGFLSGSKIETTSPEAADERSATRLDGFYGLELNQPLRDGVNLRLKAGARGFQYEGESFEADGPGGPFEIDPSAERVFAELGADLNLKAYSVFEYKNPTWSIDGLRHIVEPRIAFRHTPEIGGDGNDLVAAGFDAQGAPIAFRRRHSLFSFDETAFGNFLLPLDIEDRRDVDSLHEESKVRVELRNRLQTRTGEGGSRDLARLSLAADYYFDSAVVEEDAASLLHADLDLSPAQWLDLGVYARFDPEDAFIAREINTQIAIHDRGYWRLVLGSQFLRGYQPPEPGAIPAGFNWRQTPFDAFGRAARIAEYYALFERNLGENFKLYASARYDEVNDVFYEQSVGLKQRAVERYAISYELRLYDGPRREDTFGVSVGVELFDK